MMNRQNGEDIEASAQLISKQVDESRDNSDSDFDFGLSNGVANKAYHNWHTRFRSSSRQLRRHLQSFFQALSGSSSLLIRKSNRLNPRYLAFGFVVSFIATTLIFSSYRQPKSIPTPSKSASATITGSPDPTHTPLSEPNSEFCTTWPVDEDGTYDLHAHNHSSRFEQHSIAPHGGWQKPKGLKVIAMVFFGRKRYVDILDCYLQQNLASNNGYLDEVWFMVHTEDADDISWLNALARGTPEYKIFNRDDCQANDGYGCMWAYVSADNTIYIKLDDDIIYIHPDAIPQLVHTRLAVPHAFAVSAQLVNSPMSGMEQFHHNAIYPFVPDPNKRPRHNASETWRLSKLNKSPESKLAKLRGGSDDSIMYPKVPYRGHPFVLLSEDNFDLIDTSMGRYDQDPGGDPIAFSPPWKSWAMGAQQQYSLLYNIEKNQIDRYFFGRPAVYPENSQGPDRNSTVPAPKAHGKPKVGGEQIFDTQFRRYNLNFCAVWGSDIKKHLPMDDDDEYTITSGLPKKTGRPFIIDTRAIVGHFSFYTQVGEIRQTDLLDRWRAFANEAVCKPDNLKKPWDLRCPDFEE
ncbi:hypothetical protein GQX73_g1537 [Xylaria multiplex]|uniref:Uncharacterized protein n=1 Tax=Xylaria multiplex TaxID=323545 RepID=A0A7C8MXM6_9PEZI|nr:hypothetical protein GQX73_g1537 [Xylaria multiplex]